jgi:hypothetical protein
MCKSGIFVITSEEQQSYNTSKYWLPTACQTTAYRIATVYTHCLFFPSFAFPLGLLRVRSSSAPLAHTLPNDNRYRYASLRGGGVPVCVRRTTMPRRRTGTRAPPRLTGMLIFWLLFPPLLMLPPLLSLPPLRCAASSALISLTHNTAVCCCF